MNLQFNLFRGEVFKRAPTACVVMTRLSWCSAETPNGIWWMFFCFELNWRCLDGRRASERRTFVINKTSETEFEWQMREQAATSASTLTLFYFRRVTVRECLKGSRGTLPFRFADIRATVGVLTGLDLRRVLELLFGVWWTVRDWGRLKDSSGLRNWRRLVEKSLEDEKRSNNFWREEIEEFLENFNKFQTFWISVLCWWKWKIVNRSQNYSEKSIEKITKIFQTSNLIKGRFTSRTQNNGKSLNFPGSVQNYIVNIFLSFQCIERFLSTFNTQNDSNPNSKQHSSWSLTFTLLSNLKLHPKSR